MKIIVLHAKDPNFRDRDKVITLFELSTEFDAVALIETKDVLPLDTVLGWAFDLTNHVDQNWWENEKVKLLKQSRSTSVGDVMILEDEKKTERVFGVDGWGFQSCICSDRTSHFSPKNQKG